MFVQQCDDAGAAVIIIQRVLEDAILYINSIDPDEPRASHSISTHAHGGARRQMLGALLLGLHAADLVGVSPNSLSGGGGTTLWLTAGSSAGGLLAGSAWAGNSTVPRSLSLCCDFNGDVAPIGGESVALLHNATSGSCVVPNVNAAGAAEVRLFLSEQPTCHGAKGARGGWLTGQVAVHFVSKASILSFAPGRRPYVSESAGALVVKMAAGSTLRTWLPAPSATSALRLQLTATLDLPTGSR